jgi:hypothetical protein
MMPSEIENALKSAFLECDRKFCPLSDRQREIILKTLLDRLTPAPTSDDNPLEELGDPERELLLAYIQSHDEQSQNWKIRLLNDWLLDRDSGSVQFIRENYGFSWLNRVQDSHIQAYLPESLDRLKVGDRIEVSSNLWEWGLDANDAGEWITGIVVGLREVIDGETSYAIATVRFTNGMEVEIPGTYEWNRGNWRAIAPDL